MSDPKKVVLLGATGSIGNSALKVIRAHPKKLKLIGVSANSNSEKLFAIADEFSVSEICLIQPTHDTNAYFGNASLRTGSEGLQELAALPETDIVLVAIVGAAGLQPTLAAIGAGKDIVLANKEALVLGGKFVMEAASKSESRILPADSEHNAIFQCLEGTNNTDVQQIILTASGGPFRDMTLKEMAKVTPEQALKHPNWSMGPKITIDSATMANKGLELIEARWLFDMQPENLDVVIHPTSIVHSIVHFTDGCMLAQLSPPSMTFALQHALLYPERLQGVDAPLDLSQELQLSFRPPDLGKFPCLRLAREALASDGIAPAIYNAANEVAAEAFLGKRIGFLEISSIIETTLSTIENHEPTSLEEVFSADAEARRLATEKIDS